MNIISSPYEKFFVASSAFDPTESKILSFASLGNGWHYGTGIAFSEAAIDDALLIHRQVFFKGYTRTNAFPGQNGEIQVTMYHKDHFFGFEREASGLWNITHEINDHEVEFLERETCDRVIGYINALRSKICDTSDVYSKAIGTLTGGGSFRMPLGETRTASLSLRRTACLLPAQLSAIT